MLRHRRDVVLSIGAALLGSVAQTAVPLVARQIVDGVILEHTSPLWPWLVLLVSLAAASFAFAYVRRYRGGKVALEVQYDLRNAMHDHLQALDFDNLNRMPTGQLVARANSDSTLIQGLLSFFPIMSSNLLLTVLSLTVMVYLSPLLALVSVVIVPCVLVVSYRMRWRIFPATWDAQQREGDLVQIVDEDLNGVRVVKAFGQEDRELERVGDAAKVLYGSQMRAVRLQSRYQPLLEAIPTLAQVAILALGGWLALRHQITLGTFLAFSTYVTQLIAPARQLAGVLTVGQQARAGLERIFQLLDMPAAISDAPDAVELPTLRGAVTFSNVHFRYGDAAPVLHGIDLQISPGERVAFVGPSGSGKTTLAMLVSRFYDPTEGAVFVDGHDVRGVRLRPLRRQIGVVFEESFLFSDSVRANIAYGRPDATDEQIEAAARAAQAHDFIEELPRGYATTIGERGLTLSGGQRQRIALARAILYDPRILILDDATSAIDARIESSVHDALRAVMSGRTTLLIAHRRSTLHLADRIVVLDEGRVVEQGTHDALAARSPLYRSLLSGLAAGDADDPVELLATVATAEAPDGTASSWAGASQRSASRVIGAPSIGPGLGAGGGWRLSLAPTPDLLARVARLRPARDIATVDLERESRRDTRFGLTRLLREFRRPLLFGLVLVVIDGLLTVAGPILVKIGVDDGVSAGSARILFAAAGVFLVAILVDLADQTAETFVTGRAAQRIMSHELRTPLNAVIGFSEVLQDRLFGELNDKQAEYVADIHTSGRHLLTLINDILDLSKIEAGRMELQITAFALSDVLENSVALMRERATRQGIPLGLEVDPSAGVIEADERKVKQVLFNLLTNALKFTTMGGHVDVSARSDGDSVIVSVRDDGVGIAEADQVRIFEEFQQVGTSQLQEGTGLGLALSRRFVELHGGRLGVESEPGQGSTFTFTLPRIQPSGTGADPDGLLHPEAGSMAAPATAPL
jgi:ATP-binding cassette, subfamily B, bacterial